MSLVKSLKALLIITCALLLYVAVYPTDAYIRRSVVQLTNGQMSCTGEQIIAPSGKLFVITAAHCRGISEGTEKMTAVLEDGSKQTISVIAEDPTSDLLILTPVKGIPGLSIASSIYAHQHARAFTHGRAYATYKTEGEIVQEGTFEAPIFEINSFIDLLRCQAQPKYHPEMGLFSQSCVATLSEIIATVGVVPGSSGGAILNDRGQVLGICTGEQDPFSFWVKLDDIHRFLAKR